MLVDNVSTDDTPNVIARALTQPRVRALREQEVGISAARNTALLNARGKYVLYLDDDGRPEPGWLEAYRTCFITPPEKGIAVIGGVVIPDYQEPPPKWFTPDVYTFDLGPTPGVILEHRGPWGCNIAYLRDAAISAGMFDTRLGRKDRSLGAHEEMELDLRLEQAGYKVWWLPTARVLHFVGRERLQLTWQWRGEFEQSRSRGIMKLQARNPRGRLAYTIGRILVAPFRMVMYLVIAALSWPFNQRYGVASFLRTARVAGIAAELCLYAVGRRKF